MFNFNKEQVQKLLNTYGEDVFVDVGQICEKIYVKSIILARQYARLNHTLIPKELKQEQLSGKLVEHMEKIATGSLPFKDNHTNYIVALHFIPALENLKNAIKGDKEQFLNRQKINELANYNQELPNKWFYESIPNSSEFILDLLDSNSFEEETADFQEDIPLPNIGPFFGMLNCFRVFKDPRLELVPNYAYKFVKARNLKYALFKFWMISLLSATFAIPLTYFARRRTILEDGFKEDFSLVDTLFEFLIALFPDLGFGDWLNQLYPWPLLLIFVVFLSFIVSLALAKIFTARTKKALVDPSLLFSNNAHGKNLYELMKSVNSKIVEMRKLLSVKDQAFFKNFEEKKLNVAEADFIRFWIAKFGKARFLDMKKLAFLEGQWERPSSSSLDAKHATKLMNHSRSWAEACAEAVRKNSRPRITGAGLIVAVVGISIPSVFSLTAINETFQIIPNSKIIAMLSSENELPPNNLAELAKKVTVTVSSLNHRSCPSVDCEIVGSSKKGDVLSFYADVDGWVRISDEISSQRWVSDKYIEAFELSTQGTMK